MADTVSFYNKKNILLPNCIIHHFARAAFRSPEVVNLYTVVAVVRRPEVGDASGRNP